jgi:hypothetical protein
MPTSRHLQEVRLTNHLIEGHPSNDRDRFLDEVEAAKLLGLSRSYLRQLRVAGGGCPYFLFGRAVRYQVGTLLAWANSKTRQSTSEASAKRGYNE